MSKIREAIIAELERQARAMPDMVTTVGDKYRNGGFLYDGWVDIDGLVGAVETHIAD